MSQAQEEPVVDVVLKEEEDDEDLKREFQYYDSILKTETRLEEYLENLESYVKSVLNNEWSAARTNFLIRQMLPKYVPTLLKRSDFEDDDTHSAVGNFFLSVIELIVKFIPHDVPELLEAFTKLFNDHAAFFMKYGRDFQQREELLGNPSATPFTAPIALKWDCSWYFIRLINRFGELGGFNAIIDRLRSSVPSKPSLNIMKLLVKPVWKVREVLNDNALKPFVTQLNQIVFPFILNMTDDELKNEDKKLIGDIVVGMGGLLRIYYPHKAGEIIDKFNLDVALKCFRSKSLERRLQGLSDLKEILYFVKHKDEYNGGRVRVQGPLTQHQAPPSHLMPNVVDVRYMISWVKENHIIEQLYGETMHLELLRRCAEVPRFLAQENEITRQHIDLIWDATEGKHESIVHAIYLTVGDITAHFQLDDVDHLFQRIKKIPYSMYSTNTLNLIRNFTIHAINLTQNLRGHKWYGLPIFFDILLDADDRSMDLIAMAHSNLKDFLSWNCCHSQRSHFMEKCVANVLNHTSVPMSLRLLRDIIDSYPPKRQKKGDGNNIIGVIEWLQNTHNLLDSFFSDVKFYKEQTKAATQTLLSNPTPDLNLNNAALYGKQPHLQQIQERLEFLQYFLQNSGQQLTLDQLDVTWQCLVIDAITSEERDYIFQWLESSLDHGNGIHACLSEEGAHHLFVDKVPELDFSTLSKEGFSFFESFMRHENIRSQKLEHVDGKSYVILSMDLVGLSDLWKIALEARDPTVGKSAIIFLNKLHQNISPQLRHQVAKHREEYIRICMEQLAKVTEAFSAGTKTESEEIRLNRSLALIKQFLDEFEGKRGRQRHGASARGLPLNVTVQVLSGPKFSLNLHTNESVGSLRSKIAEKMDQPSHLVRLITAGRELRSDNETMSEVKISNGQQIHATKRVPQKPEEGAAAASNSDPAKNAVANAILPSPDLKMEDDENIYPSVILSQQRYFNQLFQMLNLDEGTGQKAWDLLMVLPTNKKMLDEMSNLPSQPGVTNWDELLDIRSTFKLFYSLQIVDSLMQPSADGNPTPQHQAGQSEWCLRFLNTGGVDHLLKIVMTQDFQDKTKGSKRKTCLALLLKIINFFAVEGYTTIPPPTPPIQQALPQTQPSSNTNNNNTPSLNNASVSYVTNVGNNNNNNSLSLTASSSSNIPTPPRAPEGVSTVLPLSQLIPPSIFAHINLNLKLRHNVLPPQTNFKDLTLRLMEVMWCSATYPILLNKLATSHNPFGKMTLPSDFPEEEDGDVVKFAANLFVASLLSQPELTGSVLLGHPSVKLWLTTVLVYSGEVSIRREIAVALYLICVQIRNAVLLSPNNSSIIPHSFFLQTLLEFLSPVDGEAHLQGNVLASYTEQYFELLDKLVSDSCDGVAGGKPSDFTTLLQQVISMITQHPIVETRSALSEDKVLIGLMNLCRTLSSKDAGFKLEAGAVGKGNLVHEIFQNCLFEIPTADNHGPTAPPKCKTRGARQAAFRLLVELSRGCEDTFKELTDRLLLHHTPSEKRSVVSWAYLPAGYEKANCGYVGMKNLGATCYMNSLMQQLFMIPTFRYGIFGAADKEDNQAESLLHQLKVIFGYLQESEKKYFDTRDFCNAYKCDGQPTNPSIQMDVDEFFNMLFDRLENALKGESSANILKDYFGGSMVNQFISKQCEHVSEREEGFFTISIEVKSKKSILESLDLYVEGDMLEGDNKYFCGKCSAKVDALKRCCILHLPDTLIIHNKRFEFDLEQMKRIKVNDNFEFPTRLNMEPYTKEGLARIEALQAAKASGQPITEPPPIHPPSFYEYELSGILVHTGTADSGHYYSFIREREPKIPGQPRQWFHFNDTVVESFNTEDISRQCFGGTEQITQWDVVQQKHVTRIHPKSYNAYMLFYDRVQPQKILHAPSPPISPSEAAKLVPASIFNSVWEENMKFLSDKNIFDVDYFQFLWNIVSTEPVPSPMEINSPPLPIATPGTFDQPMRTIELGTRFVIETLAHAKEKASLKDWIVHLKLLYSSNLDACKWFLETMLVDLLWVKQLLFYCSFPETREMFVNLLIHVLSCLAVHERGYYFEEDPVSLDGTQMELTTNESAHAGGKQKAANQNVDEEMLQIPSASGRPRSLVVRFMDSFIGLLKEAHVHWRNFGQYFLVLRDFALLGPLERQYLLQRRLVSQLVDFFLGEESPFAKSHHPPKKTRMGDKFGSPNLTHMVEALAILARGCSTRVSVSQPDNQIPPSTLDANILEMSIEDTEMLYYAPFYAKLFKESTNTKSTAEILVHICWRDLETSKQMFKIIVDAINAIDYEGFKPYFEVFAPLLNMRDTDSEMRVEWAMNQLLKVIDENIKYKNATYHCIRFILEQFPFNDILRVYMFRNIEEWLERWLLKLNNIEVREASMQIAMSLIPEIPPLGAPIEVLTAASMRPLSQESEQNLEHLYDSLLRMLPEAKSSLRVTESDTTKLEDGYPRTFWKLAQYFRLLRWAVRGPRQKAAFAPFHVHLFNLFVHIDSMRMELDENKQELVAFWLSVLEGTNNINFLVEDDKKWVRLFDFFVSVKPFERFRHFNNYSLPAFYRILYLCGEASPVFLDRLINHRNLEWAIKYLYHETPDYPLVADVLYAIMAKGCETTSHYRQTRVVGMLQNAPHSNDKFVFNPYNILRALDLFLKDYDDVGIFLEGQGLSGVSRALERIQREAPPEADTYLRIIAYSLKLLTKSVNFFIYAEKLPEDHKHRLISVESRRKWEAKNATTQIITSYLESISTHPTFPSECIFILENLSLLENDCLSAALSSLEDFLQERERTSPNPHKQFSSFAIPKDVSGEMIVDDQNLELQYYVFIQKLISLALQSANNTPEIPYVINVSLLASLETMHAPHIKINTGLFTDILKVIWEHPVWGNQLRSDRLLGQWVASSLTYGTRFLTSVTLQELLSSVLSYVLSKGLILPVNQDSIAGFLSSQINTALIYLEHIVQQTTDLATIDQNLLILSSTIKALSIVYSTELKALFSGAPYSQTIENLMSISAIIDSAPTLSESTVAKSIPPLIASFIDK